MIQDIFIIIKNYFLIKVIIIVNICKYFLLKLKKIEKLNLKIIRSSQVIINFLIQKK